MLSNRLALTGLTATVLLTVPSSAQGTLELLPAQLHSIVDLNHDGSLVLGYEIDDSDPNYLRFTGILVDGAGTTTVLGRPVGFDSAVPRAMSDAGETSVGYASSSATFERVAMRWDRFGARTTLSRGAPYTFADGVSRDGAYAVGVSDGKAVRWDDLGTPEFLNDFPAVSISRARAANSDGTVIVGFWENAIGLSRPFRWEQGIGMTSLPVPNGFVNGSAEAVSADGHTVIGISSRSNPVVRVVWRWTTTGGTELLEGPSGVIEEMSVMEADATCRRLIGMNWDAPVPGHRPTVWTEGRQAVSLLDFMADRAIAPLAATPFYSASAISGDGHVMAGVSLDDQGMRVPWKADEGWGIGIQTTTCVHGVANQSGFVSRLRVDGIPIAAANDVTLRAEDLPPGAFTMFVASLTSAPPFIPPGSVGALCLGGNIGRYNRPGEIQAADAFGVVSLALDLTQTPGGAPLVLAGETWHYQGWHRDVAQGQATANFTNAVNVSYP